MKLNQPQWIQIERVKITSYNDFDGGKIAQSLINHADLWDSMVFGRFTYGTLIELRDLHEDCINADEMYLLTTRDRVEKLLEAINSEWDANEIGWIDHTNKWNGTRGFKAEDLHQKFGCVLEGENNNPDNQVLVRVWWD